MSNYAIILSPYFGRNGDGTVDRQVVGTERIITASVPGFLELSISTPLYQENFADKREISQALPMGSRTSSKLRQTERAAAPDGVGTWHRLAADSPACAW